MSDTVIQIENVSKEYRLGTVSHGMLYRDIQAWWAHLRGKDDPNSVIGSKQARQLEGEDRFWALRNVNLEVKRGDTVGIIGRNGAGKSTLLKILSRVTAPTEGVVKIKGRVASLLEVGTGFHPELTGRENIYLNGAIMGMTKKEINRKFDEIVDFAEVHKFIDTPVKRYSSGMYVRLAFAVAAHLEPEILIVDEVLAVGDAQFQKKCLGKMEKVGKEGRTILFVSHNMTAIQSLCQKATLLSKGEILRDGTSFDVVNYYLSDIGETRTSLVELPSDVNKNVQIRRVVTKNHQGTPSDLVDLNENIIIQIDYEFHESLPNIVVGLQIVSVENGQCLISLSDPELDLTRLNKRKKGYYQSSIDIPPKILNTGTYQIRIGLSSLRQVHEVVDNVYFTVVDNVGIVQSLGYERKSSLLSMQLPWKVAYFETQPKHGLDELPI